MSKKSLLVQQKVDQAVRILGELEVDAWVTFVRETMLTPDPALDLILGLDMVWESAFILTRDDRRVAIVGKHDAENVIQIGAYTDVISYVEGISEALVNTLLEINPEQIALNYSESDPASDGLSYGLALMLERELAPSGLSERFISAEHVIAALRGRKAPAEIGMIRTAINTSQHLLGQVEQVAAPGVSEAEIARSLHDKVAERRLTTAWDREYCPTINAGPDSVVGHIAPGSITLQPGMLLHIDFGVKENDYCADLQRMWYVRREGETDPPPEVQHAFESARYALMAGFETMRPGVQGWEVDAAARTTLVELGYPEYQHAFGHHVGRAAHDGATTLGPRWPRYGQTPYGIIEAWNVFAVELGVAVAGYGYVGLEENVLVTEKGAEWLSDPQVELWLL